MPCYLRPIPQQFHCRVQGDRDIWLFHECTWQHKGSISWQHAAVSVPPCSGLLVSCNYNFLTWTKTVIKPITINLQSLVIRDAVQPLPPMTRLQHIYHDSMGDVHIINNNNGHCWLKLVLSNDSSWLITSKINGFVILCIFIMYIYIYIYK